MPEILLAQNTTVAPLASPPLLPRLFLEQPLPVVLLLVVLAVAAFVVLNGRSKARQGMLGGAALVAAAAGVWLLARFVQTDREAIMAQTGRLVGSTVRSDTAAMDRILAADARLFPGVRIPMVDVPTQGWDKAGILKLAPENVSRWQVEEAAVLEMQGRLDGPTSGRTQVRVRTLVSRVPVISWWRITWRQGPDGAWTASAIEPLEISGIPGIGGM